MKRFVAFVVLIGCGACGAAPGSPADPASSADPPLTDLPPAHCTTEAADSAPTYSELFERYFAKGTPGHCATAGCHANPGFNEWLCGDTKDSCYAGMVQIGLIDPMDPAASMIASRAQSPLSWINPTGNMPFDVTGPFPAGRDAILAWVAACAPNN